MVKVNFAKIELEMIDGSKKTVDFQHGENGLANQIYMGAKEIKWRDFGRKLYYAEGKVELTDEEVAYIKQHVGGWGVVAREAVCAAIGG
jgi:hypothetical protein